MEWAIAAGVAVLGTLAVSLIWYFIVGPQQHAEGVADEEAEEKAKADALKVGADAVNRVVIGQIHLVDERTAVLKERDPVDIANEAIAKKLGKKP